ncbi:MAG: alkaline phosphatase family protein [Pseudomonadota bacterium]
MKSKVVAATGRSRIGRQLQRLVLQCAAFAVTGCLLASPAPSAGAVSGVRVGRASVFSQSTAPSLTIVVVTLDGVRWHEVFEGVDAALAASHGLAPSEVVGAAELTPNLHRIVATHGAALGAPGYGATISASGPNFVSLPGYAELLSGRRATRCRDNQCTGSGARTLLDEFDAVSARDASQVALFTSWPDIARVASERGVVAEPLPRSASFRPDAVTADLAIAHLKAHPPRFLFLGLGEPDEFGHQNDYAGYLKALRRADARIAEVERELSRLAARGTRTALFVTADHGRADSFVEHGSKFPESARVWLIATGSAVRATGFVLAPSQRRLADLAPTVRQIAGLPRDLDPEAGMPLSELLISANP